MIWGNTPWIKDYPYMQVVYDHQLEPGDSGTLKMEFYITPFDHASHEGFDRSVVSQLEENELIGLSWLTIEYDGTGKKETFRNLAHDIRMIREDRIIQFIDHSSGEVERWHWDFGDGTSSTEQYPKHCYDKAGNWTVILKVAGPGGVSVRSKAWDVVTK